MDWTVFVTVISGVLTYVIGQIFVKLILDPVQDMRRTIGRVAHALIERANIIHNPGVPTEEAMNEASVELRKLSSELHAHLATVPFFDKTRKVFGLPTREQTRNASVDLIGLSNSVFRRDEHVYEVTDARMKRIHANLHIDSMR